MENMTETMTNEVMDVAEETVKSSGSNFGKAAIGVGLLAGVGFGVYKLVKKLVTKKKADTVVEATDYVEVDDCDEDDE